MVLNAAVQMLREADELKQKILKFKSGTSMLQDRNLWVLQQQLQKVYQKVLVLDLDYALEKKVEQDLWNVGFKQQIEALQAISKDRKNPSRSEGQAMLSWVLQAASGFYLCLLHQICTAFKLDLPFRRRASLVGGTEGWSVCPAAAAAAAARYIAQHCLVHLGDLHRYRQQLRVAHTFYRHALLVSAHSGQPYNQLALVAWRRARRLSAVYWHVRSWLVRAPFPPAPANLARTLAAAQETRDVPVLPGITIEQRPSAAVPAKLLDGKSYVNTLLRALHVIHSMDDLETGAQLVNTLNSSLSALVAADAFESMTLIKITCVMIWLVYSATEQLAVSAHALSADEARAAALAESLCAGAVLALGYVATGARHRLPSMKVWLQWLTSHPEVLARGAFVSRPQLWPALALVFNKLARDIGEFDGEPYATKPLSEDEELHGFLPIEASLQHLQFQQATWDSFDADLLSLQRTPHEDQGTPPPSEGTQLQLINNPELENKIRSYRLVQLGKRLAELRPEMLTVSSDPIPAFTASALDGGEALAAALAELALTPPPPPPPPAARDLSDEEADSEDEPLRPTVISEADFREKVREKRVGILKPQGSLERAREERALANNTQDEPELNAESAEDLFKSEESKREALKKPRVNIAMAAILRKQEESNKQVKFVSPPPTPDSSVDSNDASTSTIDVKPKIIQPKAIKSLANLPIGRKTGGILSLKDKSAGYPHLVNTDPEPTKKNEKEEKKDVKSSQSSQNTHQTYPFPKKQEHPSPQNWGNNQMQFNDGPRFNIPHKNYGIQHSGNNYSPTYQTPMSSQGIRLPVVNPKEIDVRSAALQKQNLRQESYQDSHKFNQNYQMSGDKKNFLNDLPPRFANQYRYWQTPQETLQNNKFSDDNFSSHNTLFGNNQPPPPRSNWMINPPPIQDHYQQPPPWWKPDNPPPNFAPNFSAPSMSMPPNYYNPQMTNLPNPYQNISYNHNQYNQNKPDNMNTVAPNYLHSAVGQPQMQTVQNLVSSQNFNSSLNNFGSYAPTVSYDSSMYPQFNKMGYQPVAKGPQFQKDMMDMGLGFGSNALGDIAQRTPMNMNFKEPLRAEGMKSSDQVEPSDSGAGAEAQGNTYSLFSGAPRDSAGWGGAHPQQSLWSGPGPSPLERLLEQQKHMKPPEPH